MNIIDPAIIRKPNQRVICTPPTEIEQRIARILPIQIGGISAGRGIISY